MGIRWFCISWNCKRTLVFIFYIPVEYSHDILGVGCPLAEHGSSKAAPADTEVFCARHTHVGGSVRRDCFICYAVPFKNRK